MSHYRSAIALAKQDYAAGDKALQGMEDALTAVEKLTGRWIRRSGGGTPLNAMQLRYAMRGCNSNRSRRRSSYATIPSTRSL